MSTVKNAKNLDGAFVDAIGSNVRRVLNYQFARAMHPTDSPSLWKPQQGSTLISDSKIHLDRRLRAIGGDIVEHFIAVLQGRF